MTGACVEFDGPRNVRGYGVCRFMGEQLAHRAAWVAARGPIPNGLFVCHACDNRVCVNVAHLFLGTHQDNMRDRNAKGRQARGLRHGMAKISDDAVAAVRAGVAAGLPQKHFVELLGVSKTLISLIVKGKRRSEATP